MADTFEMGQGSAGELDLYRKRLEVVFAAAAEAAKSAPGFEDIAFSKGVDHLLMAPFGGQVAALTPPIPPAAVGLTPTEPPRHAPPPGTPKRIGEALSSSPERLSTWAEILESPKLKTVPKIMGVLRMARDEFQVPWVSPSEVFEVSERLRLGIPLKTIQNRLAELPVSQVGRKDVDGERLYSLYSAGDKVLDEALAKAKEAV